MPVSIFSETELATLHALRRFLFFAHEGKVQRRQADQQTNQVVCLNLVTNAIVTWNTIYMNAAIERLRAEGRIGRDIDLGHLSPALYGHVNPYGKYRFEIEGRVPSLRPLRSPGKRRLACDSAPLLSEPHNMKTNRFGRVNDILLFYSRSAEHFFNQVYTPYSEAQLKRYREDEDGRAYKAENLTFSTANPSRQFEWRGAKPPPHRSWGASREQLEEWYAEGRILLKKDGTPRLDGLKVYLDETLGKAATTNWTDIPRIGNTSAERLGYPTQKPVALLERIIQASSNEGDTILDPFCGCGTTIAAAQKLDRRWIGIDITQLAISLIRYRLGDSFGKDCRFEVIGEPTSLPDATALAEQDPYQFQWWTLGLVRARPADEKKGADRGIDGRRYFHDEKGGKTKQIIFSVKAGRVTVSHIRDLVGVISREKAEIGAFLSLDPPTSPMRREAASAGFYESPWGKHPRIQLLTIEDLLGGKSIDYPQATDVTFKKAQRVRPNPSEKQKNLPMGG